MGGRLDATNATEPTLSVVTQVALDHEAVLGHDVATIAAEKAGILRPASRSSRRPRASPSRCCGRRPSGSARR
jgi:folylpolyglutamate synthase/dihydropteroate synthase